MDPYIQERNEFFEQVLKTAKKQKRIHSYKFYNSTSYNERCIPIGQTIWSFDVVEDEIRTLDEKKNIYIPRSFEQKEDLITFFQTQDLNVTKLEFVKTKRFRGKFYTTYLVLEKLD